MNWKNLKGSDLGLIKNPSLHLSRGTENLSMDSNREPKEYGSRALPLHQPAQYIVDDEAIRSAGNHDSRADDRFISRDILYYV
jgi:hypothetical protein